MLIEKAPGELERLKKPREVGLTDPEVPNSLEDDRSQSTDGEISLKQGGRHSSMLIAGTEGVGRLKLRL